MDELSHGESVRKMGDGMGGLTGGLPEQTGTNCGHYFKFQRLQRVHCIICPCQKW